MTEMSETRRANRSRRPLKAFWRKFRRPLVESRFARSVLTTLLAWALRLTRRTNPLVAGSSDIEVTRSLHTPCIVALWHGQHLLVPCYYPRGAKLAAMISRSADAELNALVFEKLGFEAVRGSGGREDARHLDKGGARALIALKRTLDAGKNVAMIADIPHGKPRDSGLGIIMLARFSGRPILPVALATSRRKVLEGTWDRTTINMPFGRAALVIGEPLTVAPDASPEELERMRRELTEQLNAATERAYGLADGARR
jgi:lysophospholipid acyltransferase (LPLAT)-like uncharacterized protein